MATLVLSAVGTVFGGPIGGAIGSFIGSQIDSAIIGNGPDREGPRLAEVSLQTSSYGTAIPKIFGNMRVAGSVIWATDLQEDSTRDGGGKGAPATVTFSYSANIAVALSSRVVAAIGRIWADGNLLRGAAGDFKTETMFRFYSGEEDQQIDPLIASAEGPMNATAHRGIAYAVFENFQLEDFGNRIPSLTFEILNDAGQIEIIDIASELTDGLILAPDEVIANGTVISGYAASSGTSREAIDNLLTPLPISLRANDHMLELVDINQAQPVLHIIAPEALSQNQEQFEQAQIVSVPISEIPKEYGLRYYDPAREYQAGLQNSSRPGPGRMNVNIDYPAAIAADNARSIAQNSQIQENFGRHNLVINVIRDEQIYNSGDIITLENMPYFWQINQIEEDLGVLNLALRAVSLNQFESGAPMINASGRSIISRDESAGSTIFHIIDLPAFNNSTSLQPNIAIAAAGTESGWRRANLFSRSDGNVTAIDVIRTSSIIGVAQDALTPASSYIVDHGNIPIITLTSENMALPISGPSNFAMVGKEIIIFRDAILNDDGNYELRGLCRGVGGTEEYIGSHSDAETFILLDNEQLQYLNSDNLMLGQSLNLEASGVGDVIAQSASIESLGRSLIPFAPVHGNVMTQIKGGKVIRWIRRARVASTWNDGVDVALYEDVEQYEINISNQGQQLVSEIITQNQFTLSQSDIGAWQDSGIENVDISIVQIGTYARSPALTFNYTLS